MMRLIPDLKNRETGINILGKVPWGTHFCLFYENKEDLLDVLIPYFKAGLENNEYCIWVTSEPLSKEEAEVAARNAISDFDQYLGKKQIEIIPYDEWYLKDGIFDLQRVLNDWGEKLNYVKSQGYDGLRVTGNTAWLEKTDWKSFTDYEEDLNNVISDYEMIAICTYSLENCGPYEILDVIHNHQFALIRKEGAWEIFKSMEQIRAETELKKSEEKYRLLIENALEGILAIDKDGIISYVNSRMAYILGYSVDEILGKDLTNFIYDYSIKVIERNIERGKQGVREQHDFEFLRKDGTKVYTILETSPINDEKGNYIGALVFMADITKRKLAEQNTKASEEKYRFFVENAQEGIWAIDADANTTFVNGRMAEMLGYTVDEMLGKLLFDFMDEDGVNIAKENLERRKQGIIEQHDFEFLRKDRTKVYTSLETAPIMDDKGNYVGAHAFVADITEHKKAEDMLRQSEEQYRTLVSNIPGAIFRCDENWTIQFISDAIEEISGYPPSDFIENKVRTYKSIIHPDDIKMVEEVALDCMNKKIPIEIEYRVICSDGNIRWVHNKSQIVFDKNGRFRWYDGVVYDITERKKTETVMRASQASYKRLASNLPGLVYRINIGDHNMRFFNNQLEPMTGYNNEELIFGDVCSIDPLIHPWDRENVVREVKNAIRENRPFEVEYRLKHKNGCIKWFLERGKPIWEDDKVVNYIDGVIFDITKRKEAEGKLKESEEKYRGLVNNIIDTIVETDLNGTLLYASPQFFDMYGYHPNEVIGTNGFKYVYSDDISIIQEGIEKTLKSEKNVTAEYRAIHKDGHLIYVSAKGSIINMNGTQRFVSVIRDITERKVAEQKLREMEMNYKNLIENLEMVLIIIDRDGIFQLVNEKAAENMGGKPLDFIGKSLYDVFPKDIAEKYSKIHNDIFKFGKGITFEHALNLPTGTRIFYTSEQPLKDINGNIIAVQIISLDVTEPKITRQKLEESEEKFRTAVENSPDFMVFIKADGTIFDVNRLEKGFTREMVIGQSVFNRSFYETEDQLESALKAISDSIETGKTTDYEYSQKAPDGTLSFYETRVSPFRYDNEGKIISLQLVTRDITKRKLAEQEFLLHSQIMLNLSDAVNLVQAKDLTFVYVNPRCEEMFGYDPGELIGKHVSIFNATTDKSPNETANEIMRDLEERGEWHGEVKNVKKDGTFFWCYANISAFNHPEYGKVFVSVQTDITDRKKAEREMRLQSEIMKNLAEGIYLIRTSDLEILWANPRFEEMFGYNPGEMIGKQVTIVNFPTNKTPEETAAEIVGVLERTGEWHGEVNNIKKDGTPFWCYASVSVFDHPEFGEVLVSVHTDITERKKAEEKLQKSEIRLLNAQKIARLGFWDLNVITGELYWSDETYRTFGFKPQEFVPTYEKFRSVVHPDDLDFVQKHVDAALQDDIKYNIDFRIVRSNGDVRYVNAQGDVTRDDAKGKAIRFVGTQIDITERKKAEEKIKEQNEFLTNVIESLTHPFYVINVNDFTIEMANTAANFGDLSGDQKCFSLTHQNDKQCTGEHPCPINMVKNTKSPIYVEHIHYDEKGNPRNIDIHGYPIFDENGEVIQMIEYEIDITEHRKVEQKLIESEEKFRELFNNMSSGVAVYDAINDGEDFTFKEFNLGGEKIDNITKEDLIGNSVLKMFPGVKEFGLFDVFQRVWKTGIPEHHPITLYKDSRIAGWRENYVYKLPSGEIVAVYDDVTPRKLTEQKLKASEERFRTLYENIAGGTLIVDENFIIKDVNERTCEITGYTRDELIGQLCDKLCASYSDYQNCLIWEEGQEGFRGMDTSINCKDGRKHPILKNAKKIDLEGDVHILENFQDIKEKKEAEEELIKLNELKSDLLTRSSHELKTPLMSIKGFTELLTLKFQDTLNDEELFFVGEIRKGCSRLETLINDILKTAELHSDAIRLEKTEEDLSILIKTSVKELQSFANSRNQNINLMLHDKLITSLEKKQIHQALNNILTNAIKYTPPNGKIEIKSDIKEDSFIISIIDSGIGFSEEEKRRIFKQFGKIERYGQGFDVVTEGSGLGLYISKKIVELHGGNIWVESEGKNKGSTFYISLPIING